MIIDRATLLFYVLWRGVLMVLAFLGWLIGILVGTFIGGIAAGFSRGFKG